ncbi:competence protein ComK [Mesobacillus zeae]|uniref:Transcriptional regulator n=1 Tax=Mesobacillus zeae TaxID=1917180 RepID=A0A398B426_9BACI|nr:competence protein ComK [Mesobacillus zeae]RID84597.1 transcriptional regulator [Mesobacillus zeae]
MKSGQKESLDEYEVNPFTMIILPYQYGSKTFSRIYEFEDDYISPLKPIDIIKKSCQYFGSSYEGRKDGARDLTGITHKVPIIIDPHNSIYFLPTTSPSNPNCIWVSHEHVLNHKKIDSRHTYVTFRNKQSITLPVSFRSFENQLLRTALLKTRMMERMKETERRAVYLFQGPKYSQNSSAGMVSEIYKD